MNTKGDCFYVYSKHISELNAGSKGSPRMLFSCKAWEPLLNVYLGPVYFYLYLKSYILCKIRFRDLDSGLLRIPTKRLLQFLITLSLVGILLLQSP